MIAPTAIDIDQPQRLQIVFMGRDHVDRVVPLPLLPARRDDLAGFEIERQTESIVANLKAVSEGFGVEDDLNELERQTDCVVANLRAIDEDVYTLEDLQELEKQTEFIVNRLKVISENESSHLDELEAETSNSGRNVRANTSA